MIFTDKMNAFDKHELHFCDTESKETTCQEDLTSSSETKLSGCTGDAWAPSSGVHRTLLLGFSE